LSQTRARIARAHAERPPQINVDWDADEPPTRLYRGESLPLPRASHARAHAEQAHTAQLRGRALPHNDSLPQPLATPSSLERSYQALRARLNQLYAGIDRSDSTLRRRVAYCSLGLLVISASSRMLFAGHANSSELVATDVNHARSSNGRPTPALQSASVSINSEPPGALISVNGQAGKLVTPAKLTDLAPGRYTIGLKLAGYADTKESLSLPADALVSITLASLTQPRFAPEQSEQRTLSRAEVRAQARELARERRAAARAAKVLVRYRARMGLPPDPVAQELVDAYGPAQSAEP
jgi:hypothetical protein